MLSRIDFIKILQSNQYNQDLIKEYYDEHNTKNEFVFDFHTFQMYAAMASPFDGGRQVITNIILNKIVPYYKEKFVIVELKDKENKTIKFL